jgi:hypothetical protein
MASVAAPAMRAASAAERIDLDNAVLLRWVGSRSGALRAMRGR